MISASVNWAWSLRILAVALSLAAVASGVSTSLARQTSAPAGAIAAAECPIRADYAKEQVANITDQGFSVIFTTGSAATSSINVIGPQGDVRVGGQSGAGARIIREIPRKIEETSTIHLYTVLGLMPEKDYSFEATIDGDRTGRIQGIRLPAIPEFPSFISSIKGFVRDADDTEGVGPALIVLEIVDDDGFGSQGKSGLGIVLTTSDGQWLAVDSNLRQKDKSQLYFSATDEDQVLIEVLAGPLGTSCDSFNYGEVTQFESVVNLLIGVPGYVITSTPTLTPRPTFTSTPGTPTATNTTNTAPTSTPTSTTAPPSATNTVPVPPASATPVVAGPTATMPGQPTTPTPSPAGAEATRGAADVTGTLTATSTMASGAPTVTPLQMPQDATPTTPPTTPGPGAPPSPTAVESAATKVIETPAKSEHTATPGVGTGTPVIEPTLPAGATAVATLSGGSPTASAVGPGSPSPGSPAPTVSATGLAKETQTTGRPAPTVTPDLSRSGPGAGNITATAPAVPTSPSATGGPVGADAPFATPIFGGVTLGTLILMGVALAIAGASVAMVGFWYQRRYLV